jgi:hypothetical protein
MLYLSVYFGYVSNDVMSLNPDWFLLREGLAYLLLATKKTSQRDADFLAFIPETT